VLLVIAVAAPAHAVVVFAGPGGFAAGYATPVVVAPVGGPLEFVNGDIQPHNVIATDHFLAKKTAKKTEWCKGYPKKKCPLFWSVTVGLGGTAEVLGLENTESGQQYPFFCSLHPGMTGTLVTL
jgi:plastocyanin